MVGFTENEAGHTLLRLTSRGSAAIAELLRLSENIPPFFVNVPPSLSDIINDFGYLKNPDLYEAKIQNSTEMVERDLEFKDTNFDILKRFYNLFEGIYKYIQDLLKYCDEVEDGVFIQVTLESILSDDDGKQLIAEAFFLACVMLILVDERIVGEVRERLIVSYLRYMNRLDLPNSDGVCELLARTGFRPNEQKPKGYPEKYFERAKFKKTILNLIVGRLRSEDIYHQLKVYPHPKHRSIALGTQAGMLYLLLYIVPETLHTEFAVMREIVDKHFPDYWVIPYYLGFTVDLSVVWDNYKAAKAALANTISSNNVNTQLNRALEDLRTTNSSLNEYLTEGVLTEDFILDNVLKLLNCVRESNSTLRWIILHITSANKKIRELTERSVSLSQVLKLLLDASQFEFTLKNTINKLLDDKPARWNEHSSDAVERMDEMALYFSGTRELTKVKPNKQLEDWFKGIGQKIRSLDPDDSTTCGRKMAQITHALKEVEQFHQIDTSVQVRQFLADTRSTLHAMARLINITPSVLVNIEVASDLSYAFEILRRTDYVPLLQSMLKKSPSHVLHVRSLVLKLSSVMHLPCVRIVEAKSKDIKSVSAFYSDELVQLVRRILEIIPRSVFDILNTIAAIQAKQLKEMPTRVEKDKMALYAQLDQRYVLAAQTYAASVFTEGVLAMQSTLVGVVRVEPKQLLEDGIRKELVFRLTTALNQLIENVNGKIEPMKRQLVNLAETLDGFRRSFQYIQDYIRVQGLKLWQEEFIRIINFHVERECNALLLSSKAFDPNRSVYQSRKCPIPIYPPSERGGSETFIGRLARDLLALTDCAKTYYVSSAQTWYDHDLISIMNNDLLSYVLRGIDVFGVTGLSHLYAFMIARELIDVQKKIRANTTREHLRSLDMFTRAITPHDTLAKSAHTIYESVLKDTRKLWLPLFESICKIGQIQLIRKSLSSLLNHTCRSDSNLLSCTLEAINTSLIKDIIAHYKDPATFSVPSQTLLIEVNAYLEHAGMDKPDEKVYAPLDTSLATLTFLAVLGAAPCYADDERTYSLVFAKNRGRGDAKVQPRDGPAFVEGVKVVLRHTHYEEANVVLARLGQFIRSQLNNAQLTNQKSVDYPLEVSSTLAFLDALVSVDGAEWNQIEEYIPPYVVEAHQSIN